MTLRLALDARKLRDYGIGTYIEQLCRHLARHDTELETTLFLRREEPTFLAELGPRFRAVVENAPGYSLHELVALSRRLVRDRYDVFHAPHYVLPLRLPCATVVTIHDLIQLRFPPRHRAWLARRYVRFMVGRALRRADAVLTVSAATRDDLEAHFGEAASGVEVIPNGVDASFARPMASEEIQRRLATLGVTEPFCLSVANPKPHKNLAALLRAWATEDGFPPLILAGARDGAGGGLEALARALAVEGRVRFVAFVEASDLAALYQACRAFVLPSLSEGFGLPMIEAMASGAPVVASDIAALREVAGQAALFCPPNPGGIAAAVTEVLSDPELADRLRRAGRQRAAAFRWELTASRTAEAYRRAVERHRARS